MRGHLALSLTSACLAAGRDLQQPIHIPNKHLFFWSCLHLAETQKLDIPNASGAAPTCRTSIFFTNSRISSASASVIVTGCWGGTEGRASGWRSTVLGGAANGYVAVPYVVGIYKGMAGD